MIVEKSFERAKLTGQAGREDDLLTLEIIPHPVICGCCILTILNSKKDLINAAIAAIAAITVNNSELKEVAEMLC